MLPRTAKPCGARCRCNRWLDRTSWHLGPPRRLLLSFPNRPKRCRKRHRRRRFAVRDDRIDAGQRPPVIAVIGCEAQLDLVAFAVLEHQGLRVGQRDVLTHQSTLSVIWVRVETGADRCVVKLFKPKSTIHTTT